MPGKRDHRLGVEPRRPGTQDGFPFSPSRTGHRQAGTSCDELKELGGWKSRVMVDRYAKFGTEHLSAAASRIEAGRRDTNVVYLSRSSHGGKTKKRSVVA